jgi:hypothetical protein
MVSGIASVLVSLSPANAAPPVKPVDVWLHDTYFQVAPDGPTTPPALVYAKPYQWIIFHLVNPQNRHRTVTVDPNDCVGQPIQLCDKAFDDPNVDYDGRDNPIVRYRWETEGEYDFFDHYSAATGRFIISSADQTVQPSGTTTTSSSTTTTLPASTPGSSTTTTTAPTSVRPFLVPSPAPTTTTTAAANGTAPPTTAAANNNKDKGKDKDTGKAKAAATETQTATPSPSDTMPPDSIFDPAALTPGPTLLPDVPADSTDEAALDASAAASLLDPRKSDGGGSGLMLMALGALAVVLLAAGGWAWFNRASRYDPA